MFLIFLFCYCSVSQGALLLGEVFKPADDTLSLWSKAGTLKTQNVVVGPASQRVIDWLKLFSAIVLTRIAAFLCWRLFHKFSKNAIMHARERPPMSTTKTPPTLLRPSAAAPLS